jgi:hypothetical protein
MGRFTAQTGGILKVSLEQQGKGARVCHGDRAQTGFSLADIGITPGYLPGTAGEPMQRPTQAPS